MLTGHHVLLVNDNGEAIVFKVTNVTLQGTGTYNVVHAGCSNTIAYTDSRTMSMQSRAIGFRFDAASGTLYMTEGSDPEVPVAFDLSSVKIQYVYVTGTGGTVVRTTPLTSSTGQPVRTGTIGGQPATLQRIGIAVSGSNRANGRQVARTVSSQVEMASRHSFTINQVTICN